MTAGDHGTPLTRKLGIAEGARVGTFGAPIGFPALLEPMPPGVEVTDEPRRACSVLVVFAETGGHLTQRFAAAEALLPATGGLWVAWPKKSSGVATDLDFDAVQSHGLGRGLVDNKVCAIDDTWSALRFVVRKDDRRTWAAGRTLSWP